MRGRIHTVTIVIIVLGVFLAGAAATVILRQQIRKARITGSRHNLSQIGLASHNYHDVHRAFTPVLGQDGVEYISWQTSILPFVLEDDTLFHQINLDVGWDDARNKPAYSTVVYEYLHPAIANTSVSRLGLGLSHYAGNSHIFGRNEIKRMRDITDGWANTLMAGEIAAGFKPWGDPNNLRDPATGIDVTSDAFCDPVSQHGAHFLISDGAVRYIGNHVENDVLHALATPNGHERLDEF